MIHDMRLNLPKLKVKPLNFRRKYDNLECRACGLEEETQKHIIICEQLNRKEEEETKYEKIFNGIVIEKLKVSQKFKENFDILENMKK